MAQTPQQRKANAKFAKEQEARRGKPESAIKKKESYKSPISPLWLGLLLFLLLGGLLFEVIQKIFFS